MAIDLKRKLKKMKRAQPYQAPKHKPYRPRVRKRSEPPLVFVRAPVAIAIDEWLASVEGQKSIEPSILRSPELQVYLKNRIRSAFFAGYNKAEQLSVVAADGGESDGT